MLYTCSNRTKAQTEVLQGHKQGEVNTAHELAGPKGFRVQLSVMCLLLQDYQSFKKLIKISKQIFKRPELHLSLSKANKELLLRDCHKHRKNHVTATGVFHLHLGNVIFSVQMWLNFVGTGKQIMLSLKRHTALCLAQTGFILAD